MAELITTKIVRPRRRPDLLSRPRLLDTLLENAQKRLMVVSAPAGYGKTSLLVDFAHRLEHPVGWYTVSETDRNISTFVRYIIGAIQRQAPGFGERTLQHIRRENRDHDALATTLINEIHALEVPLWLTIDDFHLLEGADEIQDFLESLVPLLPDNFHLVIATRTVPDLGPSMVTRLVARREIIGLGRKELRFTPEEIREFLGTVYGHQISLDQARILAEESEGWITAIILTSETGDPLAGIARARRAGSRLYDYLAAEVLDRLSANTRDFLIESSVLNEMSPDVVNALLDINNADDILETLEQKNIFVIGLEDHFGPLAALQASGPRWYRYHALFHEFLQARLQESDPERYWNLQQRAGHVLTEAGHPDQAIDYFLRAGAYEEAAASIEEQTHREYTTARADRVSRWIDSLPGEIVDRHPRLLRYRARAYLDRDGDATQAVNLCTRAESILRDKNQPIELAWALLDKAAALRVQGELQTAIEHCEEALTLAPNTEIAITAEAERVLGLSQADLGRLEKGVTALRAALDLWQEADHRFNCAILHNDLGLVLRMMGNLTASDLHFQKALDIYDELDDVSRAVLTLNNVALVHHDHGKFNQALKEYQQALELAQDSGSRRNGAYVLMGMGDVYRDLGRYTDAIEAYRQGLLDATKVADAFLRAYGLDALGQTYHMQGETPDGIGLIRRAYEDARERGAAYEMALYQLSLGAIAHEQGFLDEATTRLKHSVKHFERGHVPELAKAYTHLAQTHHLAYRPQDMRETLRGAELCLFRLGYDGFILSTVLRAAGAIQAGSDTSPYMQDLLDRAEAQLGPAPQVALRSPEPALRVRLLGKPRVHRGDALLSNEDWSRQRVQELFFYLLLHPHRTTDQIGTALWPDLPPEKVKNNLWVTVSRLRRALGDPDYVASEDGRYAIQAPRLWVDVHQFREALDLARTSPTTQTQIRQLEQAVGLYRGGFLQDFPAGTNDAWILEERENMRRAYKRALDHLIDYWTTQGDEARVRQYTQLRHDERQQQ